MSRWVLQGEVRALRPAGLPFRRTETPNVFTMTGSGIALLVSIEAPNAPPRIEPVEIGRLRWTAEQRDVTGQPLGSLIKDFSNRENPELTHSAIELSWRDGSARPRPTR